MPWACVYTYGGAERKAVENLTNQGFEAVCPMLEYTSPKDHKTTLLKPLFNCYVFLSLEEDQRWGPVNSTMGVIRLLTTKSRDWPDPIPLWVPPGMVESWYDPKVERYVLDAGTRVRVRNRRNPFYDMEGVVREMSSTQRVQVLLSIFNRDTLVEFDTVGDLEKIG